MDYNTRDYLVSRIISGYLKYKQAKIQITNDIKYEACELYREKYEECLDAGLMRDEKISQFLIDIGVWTESERDYLENKNIGISYQIDTWKVKLFEACFNKKERDKIRVYLKTAKTEQSRLFFLRHSLDSYTCEGVATTYKNNYIIENSTNSNLYTLNELISYYNQNYITEEIVRDLARHEPWQSIWSCSKTNKLFNQSVSEYTDDQKRIVYWSRLYDSIYDNPDCPSDDIFDDLDMLDGWLILQRRKREEQQAKKIGDDKISDKISNADEVYIITDNKDDAAKINSKNNSIAKSTKESRIKEIKKKGVVAEQDFTDTKVKQQIAMTKAQMGHGK